MFVFMDVQFSNKQSTYRRKHRVFVSQVEGADGERVGGSAWESNPAPPRWRGATGFEDREGHRAPFASVLDIPWGGAASRA